jgi:hypothetical protein
LSQEIWQFRSIGPGRIDGAEQLTVGAVAVPWQVTDFGSRVGHEYWKVNAFAGAWLRGVAPVGADVLRTRAQVASWAIDRASFVR